MIDKDFGILHASFSSVLITFHHIESVMQGLRNYLLRILNLSSEPALSYAKALL